MFSRLGHSEPVVVTQKINKEIYSRLGDKDIHPKRSPAIPIHKDALKYEGILKSPPVVKKVFTITTSETARRIAVGTMRADEEPVSIKEKLSLTKQKSVKFSNLVEYKEIDTTKKIAATNKPKFTQVFNKPERRLSMPDVAGVKSRLGINKEQNKITVGRNIFNRLGA